MKFVLKAQVNRFQYFSDGYYTGKSYIYQKVRYAIVERDISKAKIYTSRIKAELANEKMDFENYMFDVEEYKE